jgi:betaine-aldehyde dehydrogenase
MTFDPSKTKLFIDGKWVDPVRGGKFPNYQPTTGALLCEVADGTSEDIDIAVASAKACLYGPNWGYASTRAQRAAVLRRLGEIITERKTELARLDSLDQGKPLREALADMGDAVAACGHFADLAEDLDRKDGAQVNNGTEDFVTRIFHEPIGVVGMITPWNYPFLMGIWKVVAGIAAGCTMVLKPSELAPLSCLLLGEMCIQAGLPPGALNVVTGMGPGAGGPLAGMEI